MSPSLLLEALHPDGVARGGVVYVAAQPLRRWRQARALARQGFERQASYLHLPDFRATRYLVPLVADQAEYALTSLIPVRRGRRSFALRLLRLRFGRGLFDSLAPNVGLVFARRETRSLAAWLFELDGTAVRAQPPVVTVSWRRHRSLVLHRFSGAPVPDAVAKVSPADDAADAEAELIRKLGKAARDAGADVPVPLATAADERRSVLLETAVAGRSAAAVLADDPGQLQPLSHALVEWLRRWNAATRTVRPLTAEHVDTELTAPAASIAPLVPHGDEYVEWLAKRAAALAGSEVPRVATHNDLTMVNVFVADDRRLGIVDWEHAEEEGLPLTDFYYALVDATAATARYSDRRAAFRACFDAADSPARALEAQLVDACGLSPGLVELAFHACWVRHAVLEQLDAPSGPRPFLRILGDVASAAVASSRG